MLEKLIKDIYKGDMAVDKAEIKQNEFAEQLDELRAYPARRSKYIAWKESASKNVKKIYEEWKKVVYGFKNCHFLKRLVWKLIAVIKNQVF